MDDGVRVNRPVYPAQLPRGHDLTETLMVSTAPTLSLVLLDDPEPDWRGVGEGKIVYTVVHSTRVSVVTCDP